MTGTRSNARNTAVSATEALGALRAGQASEMATTVRCTADIQVVSVDRTLGSTERQAAIRNLQRLRDQANRALRDLEDNERHIVSNGRYAKDAVDALTAAAKRLNDEVSGTRSIAERTTEVAGAIDGAADAGDFVISRLMPAEQ